eukprot:353770-Chlamydomonas_euryale.AAC.8
MTRYWDSAACRGGGCRHATVKEGCRTTLYRVALHGGLLTSHKAGPPLAVERDPVRSTRKHGLMQGSRCGA